MPLLHIYVDVDVNVTITTTTTTKQQGQVTAVGDDGIFVDVDGWVATTIKHIQKQNETNQQRLQMRAFILWFTKQFTTTTTLTIRISAACQLPTCVAQQTLPVGQSLIWRNLLNAASAAAAVADAAAAAAPSDRRQTADWPTMTTTATAPSKSTFVDCPTVRTITVLHLSEGCGPA